MDLDVSALKAACFKLAKNMMWEKRPVDLEDIQAHADNLFDETAMFVEFVSGQDRDPNMVTRAVIYLDHIHAIPPMKNDVRWFYNMLSAIIELSCPNMFPDKECLGIFSDIETGMSIARKMSEGLTWLPYESNECTSR